MHGFVLRMRRREWGNHLSLLALILTTSSGRSSAPESSVTTGSSSGAGLATACGRTGRNAASCEELGGSAWAARLSTVRRFVGVCCLSSASSRVYAPWEETGAIAGAHALRGGGSGGFKIAEEALDSESEPAEMPGGRRISQASLKRGTDTAPSGPNRKRRELAGETGIDVPHACVARMRTLPHATCARQPC
jgi:hypothetical protein